MLQKLTALALSCLAIVGGARAQPHEPLLPVGAIRITQHFEDSRPPRTLVLNVR